jgi:2-polyprenyl-3-methyl-5-hydroxy-6-metoxy-1,4-benzoquinol methylase
VGCGTGYGTAHLAERARNVIGIDISPAAIRFARRKYPTLDYRRMDAMKLEFPPQSFDFIVSTENFEHLPDQHEHTRQLARVLRPDGLCFIATPNPEATAGKNRFHTHEFTFAELRDLLSKFFAEVSILENSFTLPENRVAKDQRFAAGDKGLLSLPSCDTTYLSNTHSFFALAKRPIAS